MSDKLFHELDETDQVVLFNRGVYRQARLYRRYDGKDHGLYAKYGGGYVRLSGRGGTSVPHITWLDLDIDGALLKSDALGRPALAIPGEASFMLAPPS